MPGSRRKPRCRLKVTMNPAVELPNVHTALLDAETLAALFRDLAVGARILDVRAKGHATGYASTAAWSLDAAQAALTQGQVSGVQVRYALDSDIWRDTLMHTPEGTRLVRIKEPAPR